MTKTIVVTGAASGIGKTAARRLAGQGWEVFALDIAPIPAAPNLIPLACDVTEAASVVTTFERIAARAPRLDGLICCAGILPIGPLAEMSVGDFDRIFAVNTGYLALCQGRLSAAQSRRALARDLSVLDRRAATKDLLRGLIRP